MLTGTTMAAIKLLVHLTQQDSTKPISPRKVAEAIGESPTYLAKVASALTKNGIVRSHRGVSGGMTLDRKPEDISLLEIYETCQGVFLGDYCQDVPPDFPRCSFHSAMEEIHSSIREILERWTLADLKRKPYGGEDGLERTSCKIATIRSAALINVA